MSALSAAVGFRWMLGLLAALSIAKAYWLWTVWPERGDPLVSPEFLGTTLRLNAESTVVTAIALASLATLHWIAARRLGNGFAAVRTANVLAATLAVAASVFQDFWPLISPMPRRDDQFDGWLLFVQTATMIEWANAAIVVGTAVAIIVVSVRRRFRRRVDQDQEDPDQIAPATENRDR